MSLRRGRHDPPDMHPQTDREGCPHPHKHAFGSRRAAKIARRRFTHARGDRLSPYLCECGNWHLGRLAAAVKQGLQARPEHG